MFGRTSWRAVRHMLACVGRTRHCGLSSAVASGASMPLPALLLRDYQEDCIQSVLSSLARGQRRLGISLATGAGKTVIFTQLVDRVRAASAGADQTLILAHRRELVEQAARHCTHAYPNKTIEIEMGSLHASGTADITIASVQSLTSGTRLAKFDPRRFKLVLVDEAHHIVAPGYMRALSHFGLAEKQQPQNVDSEGMLPDAAGEANPCGHAQQRVHSPVLVGVSATFSRFDGLALGAAIDEIVYHRDYVDMIGDGWLSSVIFTTVSSTADLSRVRSGGLGKDFQTTDLSRAVNTDQINDITVRTWLSKAGPASPAPRNATLVFCVDLSHVAGLTAKFRQHGIGAHSVTGETNKMERMRRLEAFKRGGFPVLVNCGVFTEGTDMPSVDCVLLARPTKSRNLLVQMIGRGLRQHPGKTNCHVIDMVSSLETGIVTTPTLFGLDPGELVSEASVADMRTLKDRHREQEANEKKHESHAAAAAAAAVSTSQFPIKSVHFTDYESVFDLIADTSGDRHIRALSQNAWVQVGQDRYVLCGPTGTYLRIERVASERLGADEAGRRSSSRWKSSHPAADPSTSESGHGSSNGNENGDNYRVMEVRALPPEISKSPFAAPRQVCRAATFADAVHGADKYASTVFPRPFVHRYQAWRKGPPTAGQLTFLNKLRIKPGDKLDESSIDRGTASDMITKIKHGARGHFTDTKTLRRRLDKEALVRAREMAQRQREVVKVGLLTA